MEKVVGVEWKMRRWYKRVGDGERGDGVIHDKQCTAIGMAGNEQYHHQQLGNSPAAHSPLHSTY